MTQESLSSLSKRLLEIKKQLSENRVEVVNLYKAIQSLKDQEGPGPLSKGLVDLMSKAAAANAEFQRLNSTLKQLKNTFNERAQLQLPAKIPARPQGNSPYRPEVIPLGAPQYGKPYDMVGNRHTRGQQPQYQVKSETGEWISLEEAIKRAKKAQSDYGEESMRVKKQEMEDWLKLEQQIRDTLKETKKSSDGKEINGKVAGDKNQAIAPKYLDEAAKKYPEVNKLLNEYEMEMKNVTSVQKEASTGITRWVASAEGELGIMETLTITTDKMGNALVDTQKRFRSLGQAIARNIKEVFKWAIAAQLVWLPMRKLQEVSGEMVELQTKLASAAIATGEAFEHSNRIFEAAYKVAQETGSSVIGVVEGYELAYRAAGDVAEPAERASVATKLLGDAMLLASVTSMDEAKALDTLAGGLRQLGKPLTDARDLLDSWVAISKSANVSIETLAESFAITASSADNAGIEIDNLNAYVAVLAENTTLSATEVGNAMRAFVTGYQTDTARKELRNLGIAIENTKGEALAFNDVIKQIYQLKTEGIISPTQVNKLGVAIGGGNRRATQFITILENLDRVQGLTGVSAGAAGDAEQALGEQLKTVQTSLTKLENAFKRFAEVLGTKGGVLAVIKGVSDGLTVILDTVSDLTDIFGNAIPVITAFGVAMAAAGGPRVFQQKLDLFAAGALNKGISGLQAQGNAPGFAPISRLLGRAGGALEGSSLAANFGTALPAGLAVGLQSFASFKTGQKERGRGQLIGGGAGIIGGVAAGLSTGGTLIAAQIGSMIAGAFADAVFNYEADFTEFFGRAFKSATEEASNDPTTKSDLTELIDQRDKLVQDLLDKNPFKLWIQEATGDIVTFADNVAKIWGVGIGLKDQLKDVSRVDIAIGTASPEERTRIAKLEEAIRARQDDTYRLENDDTIKFYKDYEKELTNVTKKYKELLRAEAISGEISSKDFKEKIESIEGFDYTVAGFATIAGEEFKKLNPEISTTADLLDTLYGIFYDGSAEQLQLLQSMTDEWRELNLEPEKNAEAMEKLKNDIANLATAIETEIRKSKIKFPVVLDVSKTYKSELDKIKNRAIIIDEEKVAASVAGGFMDAIEGLSPEEIYEPFLAYFKDEGFVTIKGVSQEAFRQALEEGLDEDIIREKFSGLGLTDFGEATFAQIEKAAELSKVAQARIKEKVPSYEGKIEDVLVKAADGWGVVSMNQELTNLILKDILDTQEKQLEGIYNLPADMSVYVPFAGNALTQGGASGSSGGILVAALDEVLGKYFGNKGEGFGAEVIADATNIVRDAIGTRPYEQESGQTQYTPADIKKLVETSQSREEQWLQFSKDMAVDPAKTYADFFYTPNEPGRNRGLNRRDEQPQTEVESFLGGMLSDLINLFLGEGLIGVGTGGGGALGTNAGLQDDFKGIVDWLKQLLEDMKSGQFYEDNTKGAPTPDDTFTTIEKILQGLGLFDPYSKEGDAKSIFEILKEFFKSLVVPSVSLEIQSNTLLTLDGQTVATSVKSYLEEDLLAQETASGDIAKSVVI